MSRTCQFTDPCTFSEQAQEILEELFYNHGNLGEVIQALGTWIAPDTFVHLERYLYVLPEQAEDKILPNLFNIVLVKWNLKTTPAHLITVLDSLSRFMIGYAFVFHML